MNTTTIAIVVTEDEHKDIEAPCLFYGVRTITGLIEAMGGSIERLQERLHKATNPLWARNYRYG